MGEPVSLRVGVIGVGAMGAEHVRNLTQSVPAARVSEIFDADPAQGRSVAVAAGASVAPSAQSLIDSDEVDAVIICTPDFTHAELSHACIGAGKPTLCEKPLALTAEESSAVVEAEVASGRQLVQVGFMRRYDPGFIALRDAALGGGIGLPRIVHCVHRNARSHTSTSSANLITGSMIHELDMVRWLLDDEVAGITVRSPITNGFADPQLATIDMVSGTLVSVEVFVNAAYGYDVRCEVVGTAGTASLSAPQSISTRRAGADSVAISDHFVARFVDAYRLELGDWVGASLTGRVRGPSAWDGHVANVIAAAGVEALRSGGRAAVRVPPRPVLYA